MFEIYREISFSAAHQLLNYNGKCERLHGHNWKIRVYLFGTALDQSGMLVDFHLLDKWMRAAVADLDHRHLNETEPFEGKSPSSEQLARVIFERVAKEVPDERGIGIKCCEVWENERSCARYTPSW